MHEQVIYKVAELLNAKVEVGSGWLHITCPYATWAHKHGTDRNPSMGVEVKPSGISRWRCLSCANGALDLASMLHELKHKGAELPFKDLIAIAITEGEDAEFPNLDVSPEAPYVVPEDWLASFRKAHIIGDARDYCKDRGIPLAEMMAWDIRWDGSRRRVCFPIRDSDGVLRGMQGRLIDDPLANEPDPAPRYLLYSHQGYARGRGYWLGEDQLDWDMPVVTVEGSFDAASVRRIYLNVVAGLGSGTVLLKRDKLDRLNPALEVVTLFDPGEAGNRAREEVEKWGAKARLIRHALLPEKIDGEKVDPGNASPQLLRNVLGKHIDKSFFRE